MGIVRKYATDIGDSGWSNIKMEDLKKEYESQYASLQLIQEKGISDAPSAWQFIDRIIEPLIFDDKDGELTRMKSPKVKRIVDIGCGIGSILGFLAAQYSKFSVPILILS